MGNIIFYDAEDGSGVIPFDTPSKAKAELLKEKIDSSAGTVRSGRYQVRALSKQGMVYFSNHLWEADVYSHIWKKYTKKYKS